MSIATLLMILVGLVVGLISLVIYLLPAFIAFRRNHPNKVVITLLNVFLGATLIVWVVCLIWAFSNPSTSVQPRQD